MSKLPTDSRSVWETAASLFGQWRDGDPGALDALVRLLSPMLWQVVRASGLDRATAEDHERAAAIHAGLAQASTIRVLERACSWTRPAAGRSRRNAENRPERWRDEVWS